MVVLNMVKLKVKERRFSWFIYEDGRLVSWYPKDKFTKEEALEAEQLFRRCVA